MPPYLNLIQHILLLFFFDEREEYSYWKSKQEKCIRHSLIKFEKYMKPKVVNRFHEHLVFFVPRIDLTQETLLTIWAVGGVELIEAPSSGTEYKQCLLLLPTLWLHLLFCCVDITYVRTCVMYHLLAQEKSEQCLEIL